MSRDHLVEFRECIEGDIAALAASRATASDIVVLEDILRQAGDCLNQDGHTPYDFIRKDIRLHIALAEIAGNPVFVAVSKMVHETILGLYDRFTFRQRDVLEKNYQDLCALVAVIKGGDTARARELALDHVRRFDRYMQGESKQADMPDMQANHLNERSGPKP